MAKTFSFVLDSFQITDTRSLHNDTDYVQFALLVTPQGGEGTPQSMTSLPFDVNNGDHPVNMSFPNVEVNPTDTVTLSYVILNSGANPSAVVSVLENVGIKLLTAVGPDFGQALGSLLGLNFFETLAQQFAILVNVDCDGPVAAERVSFTFNDLVSGTAHGALTRTTEHPGTDSPLGCGSNSLYFVTWHVLDPSVAVPVPDKKVPNVVDDLVKDAKAAIIAAGLVPVVDDPQHKQKPHSRVISQTPQAGEMVFGGSTVRLGLSNLTAP
jgi:PASTA domain